MKRFVPLVFCFALFLSLWDSALAESETAAISAKVLRLHVRASDDTPAAQGRKLLVRDVLGDVLAPLLVGAESREEAVRRTEAALPELQRQAEGVLDFLGEPEPVRLSLRQEDFPERRYPGVTLPAGSYLALRADLGKGGGANWWCVVWPPLCLAASEEEGEEALDVFSPQERRLLTASGVRLRFRLRDWVRRVFGV
jgi:stage II sporulation protein R